MHEYFLKSNIVLKLNPRSNNGDEDTADHIACHRFIPQQSSISDFYSSVNVIKDHNIIHIKYYHLYVGDTDLSRLLRIKNAIRNKDEQVN